MIDKKLKVVFLVGGYPTSDNPSHGIFNQRAAHALSKHVDLIVIQFRIYKPGRKFYERIPEEGFNRIILCVPFVPVMQKRSFSLNNWIFQQFIKYYASKELRVADLVHAGDGNQSIIAAQLKKWYGYRLITQFIGGDLNQDLSGMQNASWVPAWKAALDAVTFNSKALEQKFREIFGEHPRSMVIYRGVNLEQFHPSPQGIEGLRFYSLGGIPNYTTFEHGRNTKGGINLMEAWKLLDANPMYDHLDMTLNFAGPDSDINFVAKWRAELRKPERVTLHGKINPDRVPEFHRSGNIAIIPSLEEGLPNTAMEAAASGNLIIATKVGGIPEVITHDETGILCHDTTITALYEAMSGVLSCPEQINRLGANARKKMETNYDNRQFSKSYAELYQKILSR